MARAVRCEPTSRMHSESREIREPGFLLDSPDLPENSDGGLKRAAARCGNKGSGRESTAWSGAFSLLDQISDPNPSRLNHLRVDAPQLKPTSDGGVDAFARLDADPGHKVLTARVGLGGDLDDGGSDRQARPRWHVPLAQIEVDEELVAGKFPAALVLGEQRDHA